MMHKDSNKSELENSAITPKIVQEALENLPFNYLSKAEKLLQEWKDNGSITKSYKKRYIGMVRKGERGAFNKDVMDALVQIGLSEVSTKKRFGIKKTSKTN